MGIRGGQPGPEKEECGERLCPVQINPPTYQGSRGGGIDNDIRQPPLASCRPWDEPSLELIRNGNR